MTKMKRCILFGLIIALLLSGCSPSASQGGTTASTDSALNTSAAEDTSASSESGGGSSEAYDRFRAGTYATFAETDQFYFWKPIGSGGQRIHYYEKNSGTSGVLCFKPECRHNGRSCDAFVGIDCLTGSLSVRDGMLYWVGIDVSAVKSEDIENSFGIWRMRIDGTEREFFGPIEYDEYVKYSFQIAYLWGDFYYFAGSAQRYQPGKQPGGSPEISNHVTLTRVPVSGGAVELLGEFTDVENPKPPMLLLDTDSVYLFTGGVVENDDESYSYTLSLFRYHIAENRTEILLKNKQMKDGVDEVRLHPAKGIIATPGPLKASGEYNPGDPLLYSLTEGQLTPWLDLSESPYTRIYFMEEGLLLMRYEGGESVQTKFEYELRDMEGNAVSSGVLAPPFLKPESRKGAGFWAIWGGCREFFTEIWDHDTNIHYLLRYRITPEGLQETILIQAEHDTD